MNEPLLSVVIPTLNEAAGIAALLGDLRALVVPYEVIIADGGSEDRTAEIARQAGATLVTVDAGRGRQLRAGTARARAPLLCVLHADVRLPPETVRALDELARELPARACAFRLRIDAGGLPYRVVEIAANARSRFLGLPYGDQGLVVRRSTLDAVGGYADVPLMEDVMLVRALRVQGRVVLRKERVIVSARRWQRDGVLRRSVSNLLLLLRFLGGTAPADLAPRYRPERSSSAR